MRIFDKVKKPLTDGYDLFTSSFKWSSAKNHYLSRIIAQAILDSANTTLKQKEKATKIKQKANDRLIELFNL
jgi:hypothetical protein